MKISHAVGAAAAAVGIAACSPPPVSYTPSRMEAICVDRYGVRVAPTFCSTGYGGPLAGFTWEFVDLNRFSGEIPYYGSRVGPEWTTQRPTNITNITIIQPSAVTTRPPGTRATAQKAPPAPPTLKTTPKPTPTVNSSVQRGGLGVKTTTTTKAPRR